MIGLKKKKNFIHTQGEFGNKPCIRSGFTVGWKQLLASDHQKGKLQYYPARVHVFPTLSEEQGRRMNWSSPWRSRAGRKDNGPRYPPVNKNCHIMNKPFWRYTWIKTPLRICYWKYMTQKRALGVWSILFPCLKERQLKVKATFWIRYERKCILQVAM